MDEFRAEVLCTPHNPFDDAHLELWLRYYIETEAFDRGICRQWTMDGRALPASGGELKIIQQHAREVMSQLRLTQDLHKKEREYVKGMSQDGRERLLVKLLAEKEEKTHRRRTGKELGE